MMRTLPESSSAKFGGRFGGPRPIQTSERLLCLSHHATSAASCAELRNQSRSLFCRAGPPIGMRMEGCAADLNRRFKFLRCLQGSYDTVATWSSASPAWRSSRRHPPRPYQALVGCPFLNCLQQQVVNLHAPLDCIEPESLFARGVQVN